MSKKSLKKHMSFADNEELVKTIMSLAESEQTNAIPLSDRVRPDIRNNIPRQISSENIAELLDYSPNTTPIPLSDRVRPDIRNNIPRQISSENIAELLDYSPNTTPIPLSDRVSTDIIEANSESQKSCNSAIEDDWEEVVINVAADERHFNAENNPPGGSSEAAIGLVKSSQSKENSCPDLFLKKGTQSGTAQDGDLLLQDNSFKKPDNSNNSSKLLPSTHLPLAIHKIIQTRQQL